MNIAQYPKEQVVLGNASIYNAENTQMCLFGSVLQQPNL